MKKYVNLKICVKEIKKKIAVESKHCIHFFLGICVLLFAVE